VINDGNSTTPREPLTASQHILHLLLSVVTCGLWLPVWAIRAIQGNGTPERQQTASARAGALHEDAARGAMANGTPRHKLDRAAQMAYDRIVAREGGQTS
jgi:hypothetical protein